MNIIFLCLTYSDDVLEKDVDSIENVNYLISFLGAKALITRNHAPREHRKPTAARILLSDPRDFTN